MHYDYRSCARCNQPFQLLRIEIAGERVNISENRASVKILNDFSGGREGIDGDNHLVARPQANGVKREMQSSRRRIYRNSIGSFHTYRELALKTLRL